MSLFDWFIGFVVSAWIAGYSFGVIFRSVRQFIEKCK